jgi:hypothetical protein
VVFTGLVDEEPQMVEAFEGVYLIRLDVDEWGWGDRQLGFDVKVIPIFFRLDEQGHPTGDVIDGMAWVEDTYENIARVMGEWFHQP